jgi:hypothetical protein
MQLVAGEAVAQGEELFISYGDLRPDDLAMIYGAYINHSCQWRLE